MGATATVAVLGLLFALAQAKAAAIDPSSYLTAQAKPPGYNVNDVWKAHTHLPNFPEIEAAAKDTFVALPKEYDESYRNPCWEEQGAFKCMPYFQILGVSKSGTTDLYNRLVEHPDMVDCSWKGPHFWDEASYPVRTKRAAGRYDGSFPAYLGIFDKAAQRIKANRAAITGEASSNTFTAIYSHLRGRTLTKRINATLAEYLWEASPWARYVVMFRDPVTRYRSAFFYYRTKSLPKATDKEFLERVKEDIAEWAACMDSNTRLYCLKMYTPQQLVKGMYADFLPGWLAVWPRDQLLLLRTEDYKEAPVEHITTTMTFLGLRKLDSTEMKPILELASKNTQSSKYDDSKSESAELKQAYGLLQDFYRPYNQRLSKALGDDPRWLWGY